MDIRYRNDLYGNYMLITIPQGEDSNRYSFKMLEKNKIPGVLYGRERKEDGKGYWYVDISKKKTLMQEYQDNEMQLEDMIHIFQQLIPILDELKHYLLSESMVVLEPEYIFRDIEEDKLYVLILPWNREEKNLQHLAEFFLEKINQRDENGVNAAYLFYRQQSQPHFSLYHFLPVLEKKSILKRQMEKEIPAWKEAEEKRISLIEKEEDIQEKIAAYNFEQEENVKHIEEKEKRILKITLFIFSLVCLMVGLIPVLSTVIRMSCVAFSILLFVVFIFIIFLNDNNNKKFLKSEDKNISPIQKTEIGISETVFFESFENEDYLKLQWKEKGRNKQFVLKEFPCTVGKMKEEVNLCISDISVSRIHCRFVEQENKICIMDLNSTNGTFLNGLSLKSGEVLEIEKNDEILLGKVKLNVV